jgi:RNA polymerase sigma-70 factor (sigma-E family)
VAGDEDYVAFVGARWDAMVRSALLLGCTQPEAEDIVQTALVRCYRSWDKVRRAASPDAYVYTVLVNTWHSSRKRRWWGEAPSSVVPDSPVADSADAVAVRADVRAALDQLTPQHREVLVLRFFADLSERQVAEALGVPIGTVKSRAARALASLEEHLTVSDTTGQEGS